MYLEKCLLCFLAVCFSFFFLFFSFRNTGTRKIITLDFKTVMSFDLLVSVIIIKMVSTVRVNGSLLDYWY